MRIVVRGKGAEVCKGCTGTHHKVTGPPHHIHPAKDETFLVLAGEVECRLGEVSQTCLPGVSIFVPGGTVHTFCVRGQSPVRMPTVMMAGGFKGFNRVMAKGAIRIPEDMSQIAAITRAYDLEFSGPPLS